MAVHIVEGRFSLGDALHGVEAARCIHVEIGMIEIVTRVDDPGHQPGAVHRPANARDSLRDELRRRLTRLAAVAAFAARISRGWRSTCNQQTILFAMSIFGFLTVIAFAAVNDMYAENPLNTVV